MLTLFRWEDTEKVCFGVRIEHRELILPDTMLVYILDIELNTLSPGADMRDFFFIGSYQG